jgi:hypothetical protein
MFEPNGASSKSWELRLLRRVMRKLQQARAVCRASGGRSHNSSFRVGLASLTVVCDHHMKPTAAATLQHVGSRHLSSYMIHMHSYQESPR